QAGRSFRLEQPQEKVLVTAGETLTLTCTASGTGPLGPVKWLKGWGSDNKTVYEQRGSFPRVTRVVDGSNTDFSIHIRDVQPEDSGTYYCVKFRKSVYGLEMFAHGKGTEVSLYEPTLVPGMVAAVVVLCFLLLLGLSVALCMYRRRRRGEGGTRFPPIPLRCCAGTPSTPRFDLSGARINHLPASLQQSSKEDNDIHYADLQPLPAAPWGGRSPGPACSEYASVRVAAK
ncbi:SHPS1 phosphatase, partial [Baryphthengus martii]|nr:SHPS1 phosphatase [Baryphthengus martii]